MRLGAGVCAVFMAMALVIPAAWLGAYVFKDYGLALFLGVPFVLGFLTAMIYSGLRGESKLVELMAVSFSAAVFAGSLILVTGFDGLICLIMASPLLAGMSVLGGLVAYSLRKSLGQSRSKLFNAAFLALPILMGLEHWQKPAAPMLKVTSRVDIKAPPGTVWRHVVTFSTLPPPTEMVFKTGIAYPIKAEIEGQGKGAVRRCVFSTGPFVEPIETWDEPTLLRFSVTENPEPMRELSPWGNVHPPHLDGFLVSKQGQFRLIPLADGGTRLEGTTWYQHNLWPATYWQRWSDYIIHRIHMRVLDHIKQLSEKEGSR